MITKKRILYITLVLLVVFSFIGISYAFFYFSVSMNNNNVANSNCFKVTFEDSNNISLLRTYPMSESDAINLEPYHFKITNTCNVVTSYDINIETLNSSTMEESEIRYKLNNHSSKVLGSASLQNDIINNDVKSSRNIYSGELNSNESKTFNLRMWIDEDSTYENSADKEFNSKVVVISSYSRKEYSIAFDGGEIFREDEISSSFESNGIKYVYENGVITMTSKTDDAYTAFPIYGYIEKGKKYHFEIESDGEYSTSPNDVNDTIHIFLRQPNSNDRVYVFMKDKSYDFTSSKTIDIELRLDINKSGCTHTFSNWSLKEIIDDKTVKSGGLVGDLPTPGIREGYEFAGWYDEDDNLVNSNTIFDYGSDITLHAKWNNI